ncbi:MAG: hypothetical protein INR69_17730 [Mucilaginibacter polytrichastri]|nr:hypothetical protein [Mucilaginibacter polytrichastri]
MKTRIRLYRNAFFTFALLASCNSADQTDTIPGIYTSQAGGTSGISRDTLIIEAQGADNFRVVRRGRFVRYLRTTIDSGRTSADYIGRFEPETQTLQFGSRGKSIRIDPDQKRLWFGSRVYHKSR